MKGVRICDKIMRMYQNEKRLSQCRVILNEVKNLYA